MNDLEWLTRTEMLIGKDNIKKLQNSNIILFGLGGVGSYVAEGLVRTGICNITLVDKDIVDITNINRQIIADTTTVGKAKVEVEKNRLLNINPKLNVLVHQEFVNYDNMNSIMNYNLNVDYVIDAIDTVTSKIGIIKYCYEHNIKLISCMGTGNKLDASKFEITDINNTSVCPLAKVIRKELKKLNIPHLTVLYSKEEPLKTSASTPASISFVPSVAGLLIAGKVVKDLIEL